MLKRNIISTVLLFNLLVIVKCLGFPQSKMIQDILVILCLVNAILFVISFGTIFYNYTHKSTISIIYNLCLAMFGSIVICGEFLFMTYDFVDPLFGFFYSLPFLAVLIYIPCLLLTGHDPGEIPLIRKLDQVGFAIVNFIPCMIVQIIVLLFV